MYVKSGIYHIYNRGCNKGIIFFNEDNYLYLLEKLKVEKDNYEMGIIAYCLMPNHYHFLIQQKSDKTISSFIQKIFNGYVQAINKQQNRSGTLFEGRSKSILIDDEIYLTHLIRYIHINPVTAGLVTKPEQWQFSNYLEWIGDRNSSLFSEEVFNNLFDSHKQYKDLMVDYVEDLKIVKGLERYLFD